MTSKNNDFKRDIYYDVQAALNDKHVVFLLGPRKCGKTVCLSQLNKSIDNSIFVDFKNMSDDDSCNWVKKIVMSIESGEDITYLLDEVTNMYHPEEEISKIALAYSNAIAKGMKGNINTKVVFTGSQSIALKAWGLRAFCNQAKFVNSDFLNYAEWLRYKDINEISVGTFKSFISGTKEFYDFDSLRDYLEGCLEETVTSNEKSKNLIVGNESSLLDVDGLLNVLYATLFSLHDRSSSSTFFKNDSIEKRINYLIKSNSIITSFPQEELKIKIAESFIAKYNSIKTMDIDTIKQALVFLYKSDLITLTPVFDNFETSMNVCKALLNDDEKLSNKDKLFRLLNINIKYPMFYMEILKDVLGSDYSIDMPNSIIGGVVECYVRGLLPDSYSFEFYDYATGDEIDYVSLENMCGIEISTTDKDKKQLHFHRLPEGYKKILLTGGIKNNIETLIKIPYYEYIYNLCVEKENIIPLVEENIIKEKSTKLKKDDL